MVENNKTFTAKDARHVADSTELVQRRIFKLIKDAAEEGSVQLCYNIAYASKELLGKIKKVLTNYGYTVNIKTDDQDYTIIQIKW